MLDGINALISVFAYWVQTFLKLPFYGSLTWGYFLIAVNVMAILIVFFISRFKGGKL